VKAVFALHTKQDEWMNGRKERELKSKKKNNNNCSKQI
jgi:hypothetical protein